MNRIGRILITGVSGFLGRAIAYHFSRRGILVFGVDRTPAEIAPIDNLRGYSALNLPDVQFDVLLAKWQPQAVIHCAGRASVSQSMQNPLEDYQQSPELSFFVLDTIRRIVPECAFLLLSSAAVYGNPVRLPVRENDALAPISAYGFHKWQCELICQEFTKLYGLKTASARVFSAYGPGLRRQVMWDIAYKALTEPYVVLQGTGQESRDFIYVDDIVHGLETILERSPLVGDVYNLASGIETNIESLSSMILSSAGFAKPAIFNGKLPSGTPINWRADISLLSSLGFFPRTKVQAGVESFVDWVKKEIVR